MHRLLISAALLLTAASASAQLNNVVEVESSYQPVVKEAHKISVLPTAIPTPARHYNVQYDETLLPPLATVFQPIQAGQSEAAVQGTPRGFFGLGGGNNGLAFLRGAYGFRLTEADRLDVDLSLRGFDGKVKSAIPQQPKRQSRFYTTRAAVDYVHQFAQPTSLVAHADVESQAFNYPNAALGLYGLPLYPTDKQRNPLVTLSAALRDWQTGPLTLGAGIDVRTFTQQYVANALPSDDKADEFQIGGQAEAAYDLGADRTAALSVDARTIQYDYEGYDFQSLTSLALHPSFTFRPTPQSRLRLGAVVNFASGLESSVDVAPEVEFTFLAMPTLEFFAYARGGEVLNDFRRFAQLTPYWRHTAALVLPSDGAPRILPIEPQLPNQFDQIRATAGVNWSPAAGTFLKLYGGYDRSLHRAELLADGRLLAADGSLVHLNAELDYAYSDAFRITAAMAWNAWGTDAEKGVAEDNATAWRPTLELSAKADWQPIQRLHAGVDWLLQTFSDDDAHLYNRPNTLNLGAFASYRLPVPLLEQNGGGLSIQLRADNLLNRSYDAYPMVRALGTNFLAGAAWTF